ncbi:hypothetical protein HW932_20010 [Allochromatium humboldtianum]|uniref:Uncharacterized protein n=1 Tax=Allochromatium humboldtianum TaxID=504901 RepID=A0A850R9X5_9GAMM|nr:hypothetical protein [Allochromatium humboldtianum]NVZ11539.1 hypothetical protein [Allochromatium humboldtianum]
MKEIVARNGKRLFQEFDQNDQHSMLFDGYSSVDDIKARFGPNLELLRDHLDSCRELKNALHEESG